MTVLSMSLRLTALLILEMINCWVRQPFPCGLRCLISTAVAKTGVNDRFDHLICRQLLLKIEQLAEQLAQVQQQASDWSLEHRQLLLKSEQLAEQLIKAQQQALDAQHAQVRGCCCRNPSSRAFASLIHILITC